MSARTHTHTHTHTHVPLLSTEASFQTLVQYEPRHGQSKYTSPTPRLVAMVIGMGGRVSVVVVMVTVTIISVLGDI